MALLHTGAFSADETVDRTSLSSSANGWLFL